MNIVGYKNTHINNAIEKINKELQKIKASNQFDNNVLCKEAHIPIQRYEETFRYHNLPNGIEEVIEYEIKLHIFRNIIFQTIKTSSPIIRYYSFFEIEEVIRPNSVYVISYEVFKIVEAKSTLVSNFGVCQVLSYKDSYLLLDNFSNEDYILKVEDFEANIDKICTRKEIGEEGYLELYFDIYGSVKSNSLFYFLEGSE